MTFSPTESHWTQTGAAYTDTPERREEILRAIADLEWHDLGTRILAAPHMHGEALKAVMAQISGRHTAVAWNAVVGGRYALLGLQAEQENAIVRSYWLDLGTQTVCVRHEGQPREPGQAES